MTINKDYPCNSKNYGNKRNTSAIKYIVLHYTANKTDKAINNCKYFQTSGRNASAHYFVGDDGVYQSVEDDCIAWSVGGSRYSNYKNTGGAKFYGICTNSNSLNIEMCSQNGVITDKTQNNAAELVKFLMNKYNIKIENVIRHFDVTGKNCPGWNGWSNNGFSKWNAFKSKLTSNNVKQETTTNTNSSFTIKVTADVLNVRSGAGTNYPITTKIKQNQVYTIVEVKNGWGKLKSGAGWINLSYTTKIGEVKQTTTTNSNNSSYRVKITANVLNVRQGAGTNYKVTTQVKKNQVYTIVETQNGWGKLKSGAGWINLSYTTKI